MSSGEKKVHATLSYQTPVVWVGDLSGFRVEEWGADGVRLILTHRCGWFDGISDVDQFLGNIVLKAMDHRHDTCAAYLKKEGLQVSNGT